MSKTFKRDTIRAAARDLTCRELELLLTDSFLCVAGTKEEKEEPVCKGTLDAWHKFYELLGEPLRRLVERKRFLVYEVSPGVYREVPGDEP